MDTRIRPGQHLSPATQFRPGVRSNPATEFKRGEHRAPSTEFKPGQEARNKLPIGSVRIRVETHTGLSRAWVKVAEPNVWKKRAIVVWEAAHGPLARGLVVHHKDRDSLNDSIENLAALTREEHVAEHRSEMAAAKAEASR